jgi:hypothetical protein
VTVDGCSGATLGASATFAPYTPCGSTPHARVSHAVRGDCPENASARSSARSPHRNVSGAIVVALGVSVHVGGPFAPATRKNAPRGHAAPTASALERCASALATHVVYVLAPSPYAAARAK